MLLNYVRVKVRSIRRARTRFVVELVSLCCGLVCFLFTISFVRHEKRYDDFHRDSDRIYRLTDQWGKPGNYTRPAITPNPWAHAIQSNFGEVENYTRVRKMLRFNPMLSVPGVRFFESNFISADSTFFDVFSFALKSGDPRTALDEPRSVIMTEEKARKYFGEKDPLGEVIVFDNWKEYKVTGILEKLPGNSHLHFDFIIPIDSIPRGAFVYSYFTFYPGTDVTGLEGKLSTFLRDNFSDNYPNQEYLPRFQRLIDIHLYSTLEHEFEPNGNSTYVGLLAVIGVVVLLISVFNYMNIVVSMTTTSIKEREVRRALGASRLQLMEQVASDTAVLSMLVLATAGIVTLFLFPLFSLLTGMTMTWIQFLRESLPIALVWMLGICLLSSVASLLTMKVIHRQHDTSTSLISATSFRTAALAVQLVSSVVLLLGVFVIRGQMDYMRSKDLGIQQEQLVVINARIATGLDQHAAVLRNELESVQGVKQVSFMQTVPGDFGMASVSYSTDDDSGTANGMTTNFVDHKYVNTLGAEIIEGRDFDPKLATDSIAFIINEAAKRKFNWSTIDNQFIRSSIDDKVRGPVIGVIKDFHFESLHNQIDPLVVYINPGAWQKVVVRISPEGHARTLSTISDVWKKLLPDYPFQYSFLNDSFERLYDADRRLGMIFTTFSIVAILLTATGIYSIVNFNTSRRVKEVAIRKTLGASVRSIVRLLCKTILALCACAVIVGCPLGFVLMRNWLSNFAYATSVTIDVFLFSTLVIIVVSVVTSLMVVVRAARANPVDAIKQV